MPFRKEGDTKRRIIEASIILFSDKSYNTVSVRDIAKAVGITSAAIYSHFASKDGILDAIYALYEETVAQVLPDMPNLLELARRVHPHELLKRSAYYFCQADQETMDRIVFIASTEIRNDERSARFIKKNCIDTTNSIVEAILRRLLELGRIEPLDIEAFITIIENFCYSLAIRSFSPLPVGYDDWARSSDMLFSLVKPTGK